jgi:hypothetical protein
MVIKPGILCWALLFVVQEVALSAQSYEQSSPSATALGKSIGATFQSGVTPSVSPSPAPSNSPQPSSSQQLSATVLLDILGDGLQALQAIAEPPNTIDGTTYTEFYSFGKRVFSQSAFFTSNSGNLGFSAGLAPAEIRVPLVVYPVGPVAVEIDGGVRFQADLQGQLVPDISTASQLASLGVQLQAVADGAGFLEGYANLLILRAGVGGQVDLIDAQANLNARFTFDGNAPYFGIDAMVDFLSGKFYAFLDVFDFFGFKRLFEDTIHSWNGTCYSTGDSLCP